MVKINTEIEAFLKKYGKKYFFPKVTFYALKKFGVFDARALTVMTEDEIHDIPGLSFQTAQNLKEVAHDVLQGSLYQKGTDYFENSVKNQAYFTTGSKNIDELLGGGLRTGTMVEVAGEYRTGKTQFCLTCAATAQLSVEQGGLNSLVIYIDTTNSFNAQHYLKIGERFGLTQEQLLKNLFIVKAEQLKYLKDALNRLPGYMQAINAKLIIIDSLIAPYEYEYQQLLEHPILQKKLLIKLGFLKRLAIGFNSVILYTNHVITNLGPSGQFIPILITGGHAFAHTSDLRLFLKKLRNNMRRIKVEHCSWLPCETADFYLTSRGIYDELEYPEQLFLQDEKAPIEFEDDSHSSIMMDGLKEITDFKIKKKISSK